MKIGRLLHPKFQEIVRNLQTNQVPLKGAYKLKAVVKAIDEEIGKYQELRVSAVEKYGRRLQNGELDKDENGNVQFDNDNQQVFVTEINDLLALDVPINKISLSDLGDKVVISVEDLYLIEDLIQD